VEAISEPPFSVSFLFKDPSSSFCAFSDSPRAGTYQKLEGRRTRALEDYKNIGERKRLRLRTNSHTQLDPPHTHHPEAESFSVSPASVFPPDKWIF